MLYSSIVAITAFAATALAAPVLETRTSTWTIHAFTRSCPSTAQCNYSFSINNGSSSTSCVYSIKGANAAQASYMETCGNFKVSSGWSGQFGPGNGFQTLAVVENGQIVYPAYSDKELASGKAVTPDKSYTPTKI